MFTSLESSLKTYIQYLDKYRFPVIIGFVIFTVLGLINATSMYTHLVTDLDVLLPKSVKSVIDLKTVNKRMSSFAQLSVIFESDDVEAMKSFSNEVAGNLNPESTPEVGSVVHRVSEMEQAFFKKHALLYLELEELHKIINFIKERTHWERKNSGRLFLNLKNTDTTPPAYDFEPIKTKTRPFFLDKDGYFISTDNKNLVLLIYMADLTTNMNSALTITKVVTKLIDSLKYKYPHVTVGYSGDVQNMVEEHQAVMEDLVTSGVLVLLLVMFIIYIYFLSFKALMLLTISLLSGTTIAFGISYFFVDFLNANTAFLGAIVFGNGINYSIMMMARFLEEKSHGKSTTLALRLGMQGSLKATLTASLAAGCAYGALIVTDFRGFNQFGVIGFIGMICNWVVAYSLLPTLCLCIPFDRYKSPRRKFAASFANLLERFSLPISIAALGCIVLSIWALFRFDLNMIETNFSKLRSQYSKEQGSGKWSGKVNDVFQKYLTPTVVLTPTTQESWWLANVMRKYVENLPPGIREIDSIQNIYDFLPQDQENKINAIHMIQELLTPKVRSKLKGEARELAESYVPKEKLSRLTLRDFPEKVLRPFREKDGSLGKMVLVYPDVNISESWDGKRVLNFAKQAREAVTNTGKDYPISGQAMISADIIGSITQDGPKATAIAFIIVFLLVIFVMRDLKTTFTIMTSLLMGVLFLIAIMSIWDLKINFLNFIALPITFGIGVDYAVNLFQRVKYDGWDKLHTAISETGGAIILCSLTTILGYGSLLIADNQGFVSFGLLAVLGEVTCLAAALVIMPCLYFEFQKGFLSTPEEK